MPSGEARETARHWLAEVDAADLADRRPAQLSGGQAQRVAVARALAADPELLLLDEPMAALDIHAAPLLRRLLKRVLAGPRAIIVTHDVLDACMLADRVIVLEEGRITEDGPTREVLAATAQPRSPPGWPGSTWSPGPWRTTASRTAEGLGFAGQPRRAAPRRAGRRGGVPAVGRLGVPEPRRTAARGTPSRSPSRTWSRTATRSGSAPAGCPPTSPRPRPPTSALPPE